MAPRDLRNIHTTGNRCRDTLPCTSCLEFSNTCYLESENEVLQNYVLLISLWSQVQDIIFGYSESTSRLICWKSINRCISGKLNGETINGFFTFLQRFFSDVSVYQCNGILIGKENTIVQ